MALDKGTRLGPYEVIAPLGAGGMGEVYRARDSRLGRDVAVKVLPSELTHDVDRRRRFEQEARIVASLSHPGILALHDFGDHDGVAYAVTELLEGETLRSRLDRGPLPQAVAVSWGVSLAEALAAAHARGVVHRDLKPENVFVTRESRIKVLDFGLARPGQETGQGTEPDERSHETYSALTRPGFVVGTPGYMSPEQLRGERVDARSDLFALGCVLYELLAGTRAFARATSAETFAAILSEEPAAPARALAPGLREVVRRCLEKDRDRRFDSARDLAFALELAADASRTPPEPSRARRLPWPGLVVASLALAAALAVAVPRLRNGGLSSTPAVVALTTGGLSEAAPAISPDGKFVAYVSALGHPALWVKFVGGGPAVNLTEKYDLAVHPSPLVGGIDISPDGTSIAFRAGPPGEPFTSHGVYLIPAPLGGPPQKLVGSAAGPRFSPDGRAIVFMRPAPASGDSILRIGTDGQGERVIVPAQGGLHLHQPAWSHDGAFVYFIRSPTTQNLAPTEIWRVPAGGGRSVPVIETLGVAVDPLPTPDGEALVYAGDRAGSKLDLWWHPLNAGAERRLTTGAGDYTSPRISRDGRRLVCEARTPLRSLRVLDARAPSGPWQALTGARSGDSEPSTAAGRVAFTSSRNGDRGIWIADLDGENPRPLTAGPEGGWSPALSPDAAQVAFLSNRGGRPGLWIVPAEGGAPRHLLDAQVLDRASWSGDGSRIVYAAAGDAGQAGLWVVSAAGGTPVRIPNVVGRAPAWSPREDAIAYMGLLGAGTGNLQALRFVASSGQPLHTELVSRIDLVAAAAWSVDGRRLALAVNPPGQFDVRVLDLDSGRLDVVVRSPALSQLFGIGWLPGGKLLLGFVESESQILLFDGLR